MSDLNNLTVQGRIVKNAEFTTTDAGLRIARFSIATNRYRKNPDGTAGEEAYFFPLAVFGKYLESQIAQKKSEFESLELKKALEDDRAKFSLSLDQMEKDLKEGLQRIDNFTNQSFEGIKSQITSFDSRIDELNKIDDTITNCIEKYRKDMTDSSTREFQILKGESENLLKESKIKIEALTKEVIDFLKSCQKQNQELIKKIPKQSNKVCLKDVLIYILTGTSFIGMITQMIMLFLNR